MTSMRDRLLLLKNLL